jgi:hypothetical protein
LTRALMKKSPLPLLLCLALEMLLIIMIPSESDFSGPFLRALGLGRLALPQSPITLPKQLVPVRRASAPEPSTARGDKVALRQLIIATDADDFELPTWKSILDRIGTRYDVVLAKTDPFEAKQLVRPDGVGKYDAILLTSNALLFPDASGTYVSAFADAQWNTLWDYERTFHVRQVALNTSPGTFPEDYGLRANTEGAIGAAPVQATLTSQGAEVFDYLNPGARLPISQSYLYRSTVAPDSSAQPILTLGSDVLGVLSTSPDGRERAALTFALGVDQIPTELLGYGLLRWATKGVFLGEQRHWINVDVDDWFATTLRGRPDGTGGVFRLSGPEAAAVNQQQANLRERYALAGEFTLNLAYNGRKLDTRAPAQCDSTNTPDPLSSYTRCLMDKFRWINHTFSHPAMNVTSYAENYAQIADNLAAAASIGLPVPATVLKTPEYSGLGVYHADPHSLDTPTDHGLASSNRQLLKAASDLGVRYLHGNMSFPSHRPSCFNCGIYHPLQPDILVIPDWPTNIAFEATTPDELTSLYNSLYGKNGTVKNHADRDLSYQEIIESEAAVAMRHVMSGSAYTHTLHQGNLHEYAPGKSITFDWLNALLAKYSAYYTVPLKNPNWPALASYVEARNSHFAALTSPQDAVWNRATNTITYTPTADYSLFLTGVETRPATESDQQGPDEAERYGSDFVSRLGVTKGAAITLTARPRS